TSQLNEQERIQIQQRQAQEQAAKAAQQQRQAQERAAAQQRQALTPPQSVVEIQRQRQQRAEAGGRRTVIEEPDRRTIVREQNRTFIRHDETQALTRTWGDGRSERRPDGTTISFYTARDGSRVYSEVDGEGHALRRYRRTQDGREIVLFDDRRFF